MIRGRTRRARRRAAALTAWLWHHLMTGLTILLLTFSVFYYVGAQRLRAATTPSNPQLFSDGDAVKIVEAIDGDEVLVQKADGSRTVVRIIGIKAFSASASDPLLSGYGRIGLSHMKAKAEGKAARLEVPPQRIGNQGRLLATVFLARVERSEFDLGLDMVANGYALVYTRFDFPRMEAYLRVQNRAKQKASGMWSDERLRERAEALLVQWREEKRYD